MCEVSDKLIDDVWEKASKVEGFDEKKVRKDACGAWIRRDRYNKRESIFGWEIDHIYPKIKLRETGVPEEAIDNIVNLRPLNWLNNESKGKNYPSYVAMIIANGNKNKREINYFEIDKNLQKQLLNLFSKFL